MKIIIFWFIIILIFILIVFIYSKIYFVEKFETDDVELVISRYNENLEWLKDEPYNKYKVIIYNKGPNEDFYKSPNIREIIQLENLGREGHTYLHHIINNYNNLASLTVFLPGSLQLKHKNNNAKLIFQKIPNSNTSILNCFYADNTIYSKDKDFKIDYYVGSDDKNKLLVKDGTLEESEYRPFGKWFIHHFGEESKDKFKCSTRFGILSISKEDIHKNTVDYYKKFYEEMKFPNPEVGHYIERSWAPIFDIK
jgi:hypothetical protein